MSIDKKVEELITRIEQDFLKEPRVVVSDIRIKEIKELLQDTRNQTLEEALGAVDKTESGDCSYCGGGILELDEAKQAINKLKHE